MRTYAHIGQPKCASTALQTRFFAVHPELYHLGSGYRGDIGKYIDRDVARVVESGLRHQKDFLWNAGDARKVMARHSAAATGATAIGLSCEFLGFTLGNEIDVTTKARRLRQMLGDDGRIVLVFREQMSLLQSLYTELVKGGYPGSYRRFLEYTWLFQDRNWCLDFCHDRLLACHAEVFGRDRVIALPYELLQREPGVFLDLLCEGLGIAPFDEWPTIRNARPPLEELELRRRFNEKWPHGFGSPFFNPFHAERLRAWFEDELGVRVPLERALDDAMISRYSAAAQELASRHPTPPLDLDAPDGITTRLQDLYAASNRALASQVPFDLASLGYPMS
ncbi:hypothetical protein [Elongatibacter sediminis]|uniref:Sulfotransferase n=1 Tax=Elongatibacter sediminis TaxID=3119006 RepID=A0AAW9RIH3_9GAMM